MSSKHGPPLINARRSSTQAAISSAGCRAACWPHQRHDAVHRHTHRSRCGLPKGRPCKGRACRHIPVARVWRKTLFRKHPQRQAGGFNRKHAAAPNDDCGAVAGIMDFYLPGWLGQPAHQRGVLSRQRTCAEYAIDMRDNLRQAATTCRSGCGTRHEAVPSASKQPRLCRRRRPKGREAAHRRGSSRSSRR